MHSVVCIKQVPDSAQIRIHPVTNTIMRQGVPAIINPYDLFALEEALRLKDRFGGKVTVITMGPSQAEPALRKALAFGADDAILITDKSFAGADTLATSYVLAAAIRQIAKEEPVDMVFTRKQTIDGDTAQVCPGVAKGGVQVLGTALPCLITMLEGSNAMRFGSMPGLFRAALHPLRQWDRTAAGIEDVTKVGLKGSPTIVNKVFTPTPRATRAEIITLDGGSSQELAVALIARLGTLFPQVEKELAKRAR